MENKLDENVTPEIVFSDDWTSFFLEDISLLIQKTYLSPEPFNSSI